MKQTPIEEQERPRYDAITIDGPDTMDIDDAIAARKNPDGSYVVEVHISDMDHFAKKGSALDKQAREAAFSRYHPGYTKHMFPKEFSTKKASLHENGEYHPCLSVFITLDAGFTVSGYEIQLTQMRNVKRMTYAEFDLTLRKKDSMGKQANLMLTIAQGLLARRCNKGALALFELDAGWHSSEEGEIRLFAEENRHWAYLVIAEFMILANSIVATYLAEKGICGPFRNHKAKQVAPEREVIINDLTLARQHPESYPIENIATRMYLTMERAFYAPALEGHFGLGLPAYLHFTSPIRRYADLVVHRMVKASLQSKPMPYSVGELKKVCTHINDCTDESRVQKAGDFKARDRKQVLEEAKASLQLLSTRQFGQILRLCIKAKAPREEFVTELLERAKSGRLMDNDIAHVVFATDPACEAWSVARHAVCDVLVHEPNRSMSVLHIACNGIPGYDNLQIDLNHGTNNEFVGNTSFCYHKAKYSATYSCSLKAQAKYRANVLAIAKFTGKENIEFSPLEPKVPKAEASKETVQPKEEIPMENWKNKLQEYCQGKRLSLPNYESKGQGTHFVSTVLVVLADKEEAVAASGTFSTKRAAEQDAAGKLYHMLVGEKNVQTENKPTAKKVEAKKVTVLHPNPISRLGEHCVVNKLPEPAYKELERQGPDHSPTFVIEVTLNGTVWQGEGSNKKIAKTQAAQKACEGIGI